MPRQDASASAKTRQGQEDPAQEDLAQKNQAQQDRIERWPREAIEALFALPFNDLMYQAQSCHRQFFDANEIQLSTLVNIKAGGCPEDCAYCPQSARYDTEVKAEETMSLDEVLAAARQAKASGATRFCMGGAWRSPKERDFNKVLDMVAAVRSLGLESCATLGMLSLDQAQRLKAAGLDYYNHNLDTSKEYYPQVISTRSYQDRLDTLAHVRDAGIKVCCGGILGLGEDAADRVGLLHALANMDVPPESVPINLLVQVEGTPLAGAEALDPFTLIKTIAVARLLMPRAYVRLSAGRSEMTDTMQALCFLAGANSIFYGERLLTTENPQNERDRHLFQRLGLRARQ